MFSPGIFWSRLRVNRLAHLPGSEAYERLEPPCKIAIVGQDGVDFSGHGPDQGAQEIGDDTRCSLGAQSTKRTSSRSTATST